ncbi:MAG: DedA family protein [Flavobacteriaceae bacterium]|jgi:membrane-associated protein|nr:DedA family protein [Flavobacteriaceae bacterium]
MEYIHFLIDLILHIDVHLKDLVTDYGVWVYVFLFIIIFCETGLVVTPFLPGDSMLFVAGALTALPDNGMNIILLNVFLIVAAILGDSANFEIGKYFGHKLFSNPKSKIFKQSHLQKTHDFYEKHGGKTIILARFIPIIRTFAPFVAGMGRMNYTFFFKYNIIGGITWVAFFSLLGYYVGNLPWVQDNLKFLIVFIIVISILPGILEILRNKWKNKNTKG